MLKYNVSCGQFLTFSIYLFSSQCITCNNYTLHSTFHSSCLLAPSHKSCGQFHCLCFHLLSMYTSSQTPPFSVPLGIAAGKGHTETVERLLEGGALINYRRLVCNIQYHGMYCISTGNITIEWAMAKSCIHHQSEFVAQWSQRIE